MSAKPNCFPKPCDFYSGPSVRLYTSSRSTKRGPFGGYVCCGVTMQVVRESLERTCSGCGGKQTEWVSDSRACVGCNKRFLMVYVGWD